MKIDNIDIIYEGIKIAIEYKLKNIFVQQVHTLLVLSNKRSHALTHNLKANYPKCTLMYLGRSTLCRYCSSPRGYSCEPKPPTEHNNDMTLYISK
jgi:hypothetical protein